MKIAIVALSILIMLSGCAIPESTNNSIGKDSEDMEITKEYIFEFVKENKKDLTRMAKLLSEYDFTVLIGYDEDNVLSVSTVPDGHQGTVRQNKKLLILVERFLDEEFIREVVGGFERNTQNFVCVVRLSLTYGKGMSQWLDYSEEMVLSGEQIVGNWHYNEMYPT